MEHLRLLRQRSVLVLWLAQSFSVLGDRLYALAVMWVVYDSTGSASSTMPEHQLPESSDGQQLETTARGHA